MPNPLADATGLSTRRCSLPSIWPGPTNKHALKKVRRSATIWKARAKGMCAEIFGYGTEAGFGRLP